ncbi:hypothetical protein JVX93_21565 [Mycolicibacterium boenickei]|nr:hypothetical protein JVX93_21565 [Mycolicibacterium boenickei]
MPTLVIAGIDRAANGVAADDAPVATWFQRRIAGQSSAPNSIPGRL